MNETLANFLKPRKSHEVATYGLEANLNKDGDARRYDKLVPISVESDGWILIGTTWAVEINKEYDCKGRSVSLKNAKVIVFEE